MYGRHVEQHLILVRQPHISALIVVNCLSLLSLVLLSLLFFFFLRFIDWLIDWLLCWVFVSVRGLSLVVASGGHSSSRSAGLSVSQPLLLWSTGSRRAGSVVVAHGPSCSAACGIFPDQGSNPCPLHWQADSQPLHHQGSPHCFFKMHFKRLSIYIICYNWSFIQFFSFTNNLLHCKHMLGIEVGKTILT